MNIDMQDSGARTSSVVVYVTAPMTITFSPALSITSRDPYRAIFPNREVLRTLNAVRNIAFTWYRSNHWVLLCNCGAPINKPKAVHLEIFIGTEFNCPTLNFSGLIAYKRKCRGHCTLSTRQG